MSACGNILSKKTRLQEYIFAEGGLLEIPNNKNSSKITSYTVFSKGLFVSTQTLLLRQFDIMSPIMSTIIKKIKNLKRKYIGITMKSKETRVTK